jgi:hypothetical protein
MNVLIGTPTAGGIVKVHYAHTVVNTVRDLAAHGIGADYLTFDGPDNSIGRDYIASYMMAKEYTHLFFVDSDMWFEASLCRRMIGFDKRVIGCVYPKRQIDFRRLAGHLRHGARNVDDAVALSLDYNVVLPRQGIRIENGLCRVDGFGLGAVLIQRQTFEEMIDKGVSKPGDRPELSLSGPYYGFFTHVPDDDGEMLGEDYSFCKKWRERCGGDVWALVDADVRHVGDMAYGVPFLKRLTTASAAASGASEPVQT